MPARSLATALLVALLLSFATLSACGQDTATDPGSHEFTFPGHYDQDDVAVINNWATALRSGDVDAAAAYFAIPSVAENGPILVRIHDPAQARAFNASLPCGAKLIHAGSVGRFTTATFRLTERPGPGTCGPGTGATAQTSFVIRDGKIVQWRRVGAGGPGQAPPSQSA